MRYEVGGIMIGDEDLCPYAGGWFHGRLIHFCRDPCHRTACGYDTKSKLSKDHPEYLVARRGDHLYVNVIDPVVPLFKGECFVAALDFIDAALDDDEPIGCHCNQGFSRAPSVALLHMAKRSKTIPDDSFAVARAVFETMVPPGTYQPGKGIETFLVGNWEALR